MNKISIADEKNPHLCTLVFFKNNYGFDTSQETQDELEARLFRPRCHSLPIFLNLKNYPEISTSPWTHKHVHVGYIYVSATTFCKRFGFKRMTDRANQEMFFLLNREAIQYCDERMATYE